MAPEVAGWMWGLGAALHLAFCLADHERLDPPHPFRNPAPQPGLVHSGGGQHHRPAGGRQVCACRGVVVLLQHRAGVLDCAVRHRDVSPVLHAPLALRLTPTLFILLAPPSVGFVAYTSLSGGLDAFGRVLYYTALFLGMLFASNALRFFRVPFFVSAWAYSFPWPR
jgi:tellurite resistance protein